MPIRREKNSFEGYMENKAKVNFSLFAGMHVNKEAEGWNRIY